MAAPVTYRRTSCSGARAGLSSSWTLLDVAVVCAVFLATMLVKDLALSARVTRGLEPSAQVTVRALVLFAFYAIQLASLALMARRHGCTLTGAFRLRAHTNVRAALASALLVFAALVVTRAVSVLWGIGAQALGYEPPVTPALGRLFGPGSTGLLLTVVFVVAVAPIVEEMAFRGVIVGALKERFGPGPAILASAALFAAYHAVTWVLVPLFMLGCVLAWLADKRTTLWPAIALHVLYNGVAVAAVFANTGRI